MDTTAGEIREDGMVLFRFRLKLTKSVSSSLTCHCCVSSKLGENHVGPETEVGADSTPDLKYKTSVQQAMGSKLAQ